MTLGAGRLGSRPGQGPAEWTGLGRGSSHGRGRGGGRVKHSGDQWTRHGAAWARDRWPDPGVGDEDSKAISGHVGCENPGGHPGGEGSPLSSQPDCSFDGGRGLGEGGREGGRQDVQKRQEVETGERRYDRVESGSATAGWEPFAPQVPRLLHGGWRFSPHPLKPLVSPGAFPGSQPQAPASPGLPARPPPPPPPRRPSPPRQGHVGSGRRECYFDTAAPDACDNILARNVTWQECCCTVGEGWGSGCRIQQCPSTETGGSGLRRGRGLRVQVVGMRLRGGW